MFEALVQFLRSRDRETFLAVRAKFVASDEYKPYSDEMGTARKLYDEQQIDEARNTMKNAIVKSLMLSPRAYFTYGVLLEPLGNKKLAQEIMMIGHIILLSIVATGDGSANNPYLVSRVDDEYDVLLFLGKQFQRQAHIQKEKRHFDRIECTDGSECWFDITAPYNWLCKQSGIG